MSRVNYQPRLRYLIGAEIGATVLFLLACGPKPQGKPLGGSYAELSKTEVWKVPGRSEAQLAELKPGDVLITYNEEPVAHLADFYRLEEELIKAGAGGKVKLTVLRDGKELNFEVRRVRLGFVPKSKMYAASLAKALDDLHQHYGSPGIYDWLAAMTGEALALQLEENNCYSWGAYGITEDYLPTVAKFTGLSFKVRYNRQEMETTAIMAKNSEDTTGTGRSDPGLAAIRDGFAHGRDMLVLGRWGDQPLDLWGIVSQVDPKDSTVFGYTLNYGEEQILRDRVLRVYDVNFRNRVKPEPTEMLTRVLEQALELGLQSTSTSWHSGLEAYDVLLKKLEQFPLCSQGIETSNDCFYLLGWRLLAHKESANRFFADMKEALPEVADLLEEVIGRNRAIVGKLEGLVALGLTLDSPANQQKAARVIAEIQEIENDILGIYEEIIGEL